MPERSHTHTVAEQLGVHGTDPNNGLRADQVEHNRARWGENRLRAAPPRNLARRFLAQFQDAMVLILIAAAAVSFAVALLRPDREGFLDPVIILAIVLLNAVIGVAQESRAESALAALQSLSAPTARVFREAELQIIPAGDLVRGDLILLEAGDLVPADARLVESAGLQCEESALTGESNPVDKEAGRTVSADAPLGERVNMVFAGCAVTHGRARAAVTATGMDTELGRIAALLEGEEPAPTPLQNKLAALGRRLGLLALCVCAAIFLLGLLRGLGAAEMLMLSVSLAVAAIPEGMTAVVTVVLALGVRRMAERSAIVRRLPAVETLGSASVICSDKTGTLTQNRMAVRELWPVGGKYRELLGTADRESDPADQPDQPLSEEALHLLRLGALCSDAQVELRGGEAAQIGDPTETAIVAAALEHGLGKAALEEAFPRIAELPFDSERKRMTTVHRTGDKYVAITKGALDGILPLCENAGQSAEAVNHAMGAAALRVLAVACRELDAPPAERGAEALESNLHFMGLIGMIDPPREESAGAVARCREAGIRIVMVTGDHAVTAGAIAAELGILREGERVVDGAALAAMSDEALAEAVESVSVYARVSPRDKIRIVRAWQARGEVVAMTGDGVNDAPALRAADIGCAMGRTGTEVAKGAADMVLTDDNFATIVEAVRAGRGIYDNIRRTVQFLLGCNLGEIIAVFTAILLGWRSPLLAVHLLLINLVTDALPALALGLEPVDEEVMRRAPIPAGQSLFADGMGIAVALQGVLVGALTLIAYRVGLAAPLSPYVPPSHEVGMTMAFLVLCLSQLSQAMNCRSRRPLLRIGLGSSKRMLQAIGVSALVVMLFCLLPPLEALFRLADLSILHWMIALCLSAAPLLIGELCKFGGELVRR